MSFTKNDAKLAKQKSLDIDRELKREKIVREQESKNMIRLLILGSSDSGKSTILKQLKILHGNGFSKDELDFFKRVIWNNIWDSTRCLVIGATEVLKGGTLPECEKLEDLKRQFLDFPRNYNEPIPPEALHILRQIWKHPNCKIALENHRSSLLIDDNAEYFALKAKKFVQSDYTPSYDDILNARFPTTNVTEHEFTLEDKRLKVIDVAGHKDLRFRWAPYLEKSLDAMIYVVSMNSFDQFLVEDRTINRMQDSLVLFEKLCSNPYIATVPIILFLNKMDLFEAKIKNTSNISTYFPDYQGENTPKAAVKYFSKKFKRLLKSHNTQSPKSDPMFYMFCTTATSTSNMTKILAAVFDSIAKKFIRETFNIV